MAAVSFAFYVSASDGERVGVRRTDLLMRETVAMIQLHQLFPQPAQLRCLVGAQILLPRDRRRRLLVIMVGLNPNSEVELGGTGNLPVPRGYQPGGWERA